MQTSADPADLDIVFMHGLMGHWQNTWAAGEDRNWLDMLARAMPRARVWSVEYPATAVHWRSFVAQLQQGTEALANRVLRSLGDQQIARPAGPPCVWVCHSLGGILAKRMLLACASEDPPSPAIDHRKIAGLMFLGTPHRGSDLANWSKGLVAFKSLVLAGGSAMGEMLGAMSGLGAAAAAAIDDGFVGGSQLLDELELHNTALAKLNTRFNTYLGERWRDLDSPHPLALRICAETLPLPLTNKRVVELESADPDLHFHATGAAVPVYQLHATHGSICKPADEDAEVHSYLEGLAREVLRQEPFADLNSDSPAHYRVRASVFRHLGRCPLLFNALVRATGITALSDEDRRIQVTHRLTRDGQFAGLVAGINLLVLCLERAPRQGSLPSDLAEDADTLLGWLLTALAAQGSNVTPEPERVGPPCG